MQLLTESLVLAAMGAALGVGLAWVLLQVIVAIDAAVHAALGGGCAAQRAGHAVHAGGHRMLSGVLFGCAPAWQATRANTQRNLKEGGRSWPAAAIMVRRALVVVEFALALTLLAGGGLAIHSLVKLAKVDLGFRTDHLLTFSLPVPQGSLTGNDTVNTFYRQLLDRIEAVPGVTSASVSTGMPVAGTGFGMPFYIAGKPVDDPSKRPGAGFNMVTPNYYRTFGIRMALGRGFTEQDRAGSVNVAS